jgi:hypothetical protein
MFTSARTAWSAFAMRLKKVSGCEMHFMAQVVATKPLMQYQMAAAITGKVLGDIFPQGDFSG